MKFSSLHSSELTSVDAKFDYGKNLIDINSMDYILGKYRHFASGDLNISTNPEFDILYDYIKIKPNHYYYIPFKVGHIAISDENKEYLRGYIVNGSQSNLANRIFNSGDNAAYVSVSFNEALSKYGGTQYCGLYDLGTESIDIDTFTPPKHEKYYNTLKSLKCKDSRLDDFLEYKIPIKFTLTRGVAITNIKDGDPWDYEDGLLPYHNEKGYQNQSNLYTRFSVPSFIKKFYIEIVGELLNSISTYSGKIYLEGCDTGGLNSITITTQWSNYVEVNNTYEEYKIFIAPPALTDGWDDDIKIYFKLNDLIDELTPSAETKYLPYQSSWIHFTVPINQYDPDLSLTTNTVLDNENDMVDVDCYLKLPSTYNPDSRTKTKLIMITHGAGQSATSWVQNSNYNNITNAMLNAGYAVFDCNGYNNTNAGVNHWGCEKALQCYRKAYDYVINNYNVEHNFSIYGFSMGGLTALNLAYSMIANVKCIALSSPVISGYYYDDRRRGFPSVNYAASYYVDANTNAGLDPDRFIGHDPLQSIITINDKEYMFQKIAPLKIWFGGNESIVNKDGNNCVPKEHAIQLVNAIRNANGVAWYREFENCGHEICYGGNSNAIQEYIMFFNRYNY